MGIFRGGIPTEPDVKKLLDAFADIAVDAQVTHEEVEAVLGLNRQDNRYRSITTAWREHLLEHENKQVGAVAGIGFRVFSSKDRVASSVNSFKAGVRKQVKAVNNAMRIERGDLTQQDQHKVDHLVRVGASIAFHGQTMLRTIAPPRVSQTQPLFRPANDENEPAMSLLSN